MDKFDPIRILGEGSFGKVYLMRDKVRRKFVCVKVIKIKNIPKKEREATKMEVDLLRRLHHPNIVRYIDSFLSKNNESLCIAMEYCDGGDLASQIKNAKRKLFSEDKVLHWFVQIALGLHYMHQNKVLHRDLKTQNVFLLGNGRLVLGDLGISKVLEGNMDFAQTCIGTPYYMSPEIFKNKPYSYKADVWALGCVLYEMTTLNHAFDANSLNGLAQKIIKGRYPPVHSKYSRYLRELIGQMLAPEPKQRPDLDQILRKPFIRKQVLSFFVEIASRPSNSLGEGTMIVRGALGGGANASNDQNTIELRHQLDSLGMAKDLAEALAPKAAPSDPLQAQKLVKEQALLLRREEEHRKMVEAALERLRVERENRAKERGAQASVRGAGRPTGRPDPYGRNKARVPRQHAPPQESGLRHGAVREGGGIGRRGVPPPAGPSAAERRLQEERDRIRALQDAEDRAMEEQRRQRKRESDARTAAAARENERAAREAAADAQRRDRASERRSYLSAERERREEDKKELLKEKEKLDRIFEEKARSNNDRVQENRRKVEEDRIRNHGGPPEYSYQDQRGRAAHPAAEEKGEMSAKDKVLQRKIDKQAREEQERVDALRRASEENRRIGAHAQQQYQSQWHDGAPPGPRARDRSPAIHEEKASPSEAYKFESEGRERVRASNDVNLDEMTARLNDIAPAGGKFADQPQGNSILDVDDVSEDDLSDDLNTCSEGEEADEEEDMHQREVELQEELNFATVRVSELKQTLQNTKSFIESRGGAPPVVSKRNPDTRGVPVDPRLRAAIPDDEDEEEDEDTYDYEEDEEYEEEEELPSYSRMESGGDAKSDINDVTPRALRPANIAIKPSPYQNLHDPPTPTGKLADRIRRLRDRCMDALGRPAFDRAYDFLIKYDETEVDNFYEGDAEDEKTEKMKRILGEGKVHYMPLIEQLIFMEATHN